MDDLIRKQEAIDALKEQADAMSTWTAERYKQQARGIRTAINILEDLPTIEPRKGKWLPDNNSVYEMRFVCSECNESQVVPTTGFTKYKPIWDFCPNCGADMREEEQ